MNMNILTPNSKDIRPHTFSKNGFCADFIWYGLPYTTDDTDLMTLLLLIYKP